MDSASDSETAGADIYRRERKSALNKIDCGLNQMTVEERQSLPMRPARRPIVLLHGFASSPRVMTPLAHFLEKTLSREVLCLRTSPGIDDLRDCSREAYRAISKLAAAENFEYVDVIGHSMGGLIASHLLKCVDHQHLVRRVVTLGTPHQGAPLARLGAALVGRFSHALDQMRPDSSLVKQLACLPVPTGAQMVSIAGSTDVVVPQRFSHLPPHRGHEYQLIEGVNHLQLLWAKSVRTAVVAALQKDVAMAYGNSPPMRRDNMFDLKGPSIERHQAA